MVTQPNKLFRKEAQDKSASPEQLDQLVQVVSPKRWLSLAGLGALVATGTAWSILGRIPITVTGNGVLVYPSEVVAVQSPSSGRLLDVKIQPGETVKRGQVLATIDQSELQSQIQLSRDKLTQLRLQDQLANSAQIDRGTLDHVASVQQRQALQQSLKTVESLTPLLREKGLISIQRERQALQQRLQTLRDSLPTYKQRWEARQAISPDAVSADVVLQAKREYEDFQAQVDQVELQLKQLDTKEADAQREYLRSVNQGNELKAQLKALDTHTATQAEQDLSTITNRKKEIQETERSVIQLQLQLQKSSQIVSDYDGRVLEVIAKAGQQIQPGAGIGTIAAESPGAKLVSVVFLPVGEGKKITAQMSAQVTPTTVKREEFGAIEGKVTKVSEFPITQQGAASLVGNPDILRGILAEGAQIAVFTTLEPSASTASGYRWSSSQGPNQKMTPGTTTSVRITIAERTPISYVLPILKSWAGTN